MCLPISTNRQDATFSCAITSYHFVIMATLSICLRSKIAPVRRFRLQDVDLLAPVVRLKALVQEKSQLHQEFREIRQFIVC